MCPARATRLTNKKLDKSLRDGFSLLFMKKGQTLKPVPEGYQIISESQNTPPFFCSRENRNRAISPDMKYLFKPTNTRQEKK